MGVGSREVELIFMNYYRTYYAVRLSNDESEQILTHEIHRVPGFPYPAEK